MKFTAKGKPQCEKSQEVGHMLLGDKKHSSGFKYQLPKENIKS
jgi:hypothetical protein